MKKLILILSVILAGCTTSTSKVESNINPANYRFDFPDDYNIICSVEENYPRFEGVKYAPFEGDPYWSCVIQNDQRAFIYTIRRYGDEPDAINIPDSGSSILYVFDKRIGKLNKIETCDDTISFKFGVQDGQLIMWKQRIGGNGYPLRIYDLDSLKLIKEFNSFDYDLYFKRSGWAKYPKILQRDLNDVSKDLFIQNREKECLSYIHKDKYFKERLEMYNVLDKHEEAVQKFCKCYVERQWSEGVVSEQERYPKSEGDFFMFYDYCLIQLGLME